MQRWDINIKKQYNVLWIISNGRKGMKIYAIEDSPIIQDLLRNEAYLRKFAYRNTSIKVYEMGKQRKTS